MTPRKRAEAAYGAVCELMLLPKIDAMVEDHDWVDLYLELEVVEAFLHRVKKKLAKEDDNGTV